MAFLPTNANQLQAFAGALYGVQVGSKTLAQVNTDITAVGSLGAALNGYYNASFGTLTTSAVAAVIVKNLGLTGDAAKVGESYLKGQLDASPATRGQTVNTILNAFSNLTSDATFGEAAKAWNTKVDGAINYTGVEDAPSGTTNSTSGKEFVLTSEIDQVSGTANNDTIFASEDVLQSNDIINGLGGDDTLDFLATDLAADATVSPRTTNIETIKVGSDDAAQLATISLSQATGLKNVVFGTGDGDIAVSNGTKALSYDISGKHNSVADQFIQIGLKAAETAGLTDSLTVTLSGGAASIVRVSTGLEAMVLNVTADSTIGFTTAAGATSGTIVNDSGTAYVGLETLTIKGAGGLSLSDELTATDLVLIDASASTGKNSLYVGNGADVEVKGGTGADTIRFLGGDFTSADTVDGGAGADTLRVSLNATSTRAIDVTNVETLRVVATAAASLNMRGADFTSVRIDASAAADSGDDLTLNNLNGDETIVMRASGLAASEDTDIVFNDVTLNFDVQQDLGSVAIEVSNGGVMLDDVDLNTLTVNDTESVVITAKDYDNGLTINGIEGSALLELVLDATADVTVTTASDSLETVDATDVKGDLSFTATAVSTDFAISTGDGDNTLELDVVADDATVEISAGSGSDSITITETGVGINTGDVAIDAGDGDNTIDLSDITGEADITTGSGDDDITGGGAADAIDSGDGDDTVDGGAGADEITLGDGDDTVILTDEATTDSLEDFVVGDDLVQIDVSAIGSDLVDGNGDSLAADASVTIQSQLSSATTDIAVGTQILAFTDTLADAATMLGALDALSFAAAGTPADNDDILVLWTNGTNTFLSSVNVLITTDAIDDGGVTNTTMATFVGVTIATLTAANFEFI